ncbi:MAG: hypothetical protein Q4B86_01115 [Eubacteriales bacterium]|nr:hypothetical protein [Eubacteriales bacterium]
MDIIVTGYAGFDGSLDIYENEEYNREIREQYNSCFFGIFKTGRKLIETEKSEMEDLFVKYKNEGLAEDCSDGGVLKALWNVLKANKKGASYSQRLIPVMQQTIEICEMYELNPYRLDSSSCKVWLTTDSGEIISRAENAGIPAKIIGYTEKGLAIKRIDGSETAYLLKPKQDELLKMTKLHRKADD